MSEPQDTFYHVPSTKALEVLKVLGNEPRFQILTYLMNGPLSITDLARKVKISQPTVTTYIQQLEDAGLIITRLQRASKGYTKLCYSLYGGITLGWSVARQKDVHEMNMPVGHYFSLDCAHPSILANQGGILASSDNCSRFFHPSRIEAEILAFHQGEVCYLFPYNLPPERKILRLELSAELNIAQQRLSAMTDVILSINNCTCAPLRLDVHDGILEHHRVQDWYPKDLPTCGNRYVWQIDQEKVTINSKPGGDFTLKDLQLQPFQPIEVSFQVKSPKDSAGGLAIFGKGIGRCHQDIQLTIVYESKQYTDPREES